MRHSAKGIWHQCIWHQLCKYYQYLSRLYNSMSVYNKKTKHKNSSHINLSRFSFFYRTSSGFIWPHTHFDIIRTLVCKLPWLSPSIATSRPSTWSVCGELISWPISRNSCLFEGKMREMFSISENNFQKGNTPPFYLIFWHKTNCVDHDLLVFHRHFTPKLSRFRTPNEIGIAEPVLCIVRIWFPAESSSFF